MPKASSSSRTIPSMFKASSSSVEAEAHWAMSVAKHNLALLSSDHATKLFLKIFPDSEIAKQFACSRTKLTAIIKTALAPENVINSMTSPLSLMMDESNDKTDKLCIILVKILKLHSWGHSH